MTVPTLLIQLELSKKQLPKGSNDCNNLSNLVKAATINNQMENSPRCRGKYVHFDFLNDVTSHLLIYHSPVFRSYHPSDSTLKDLRIDKIKPATMEQDVQQVLEEGAQATIVKDDLVSTII